MKLSQDTIAEIQSKLEIEEVVSDFVSLKRKGQNLWACCPFHHEKSPSFSVAPAKGIFKCFGCGKAGDAITFVMEIEGLSYPEALRYLAQKYGVEIAEEEYSDAQQEAHNEKESLYIVTNFAARYFQELLKNHEQGRSIGLSYFKQRGFNDLIIEKFGLGYSLEEWDGLLKAAKAEGFSEALLEKAGLIVRKDREQGADRLYDRFRGRVIFPIHNISGKPIAFGARILTQEKKQPKYLNSPETPIYHKSDVLYGISQAKQAIRQQENCYLVEGYTDVISLHLSGVENVVASSGTSLTEGQIRLIGRYAKQITVLFDGDPAGLKASLRGIDMILAGGLHVKVVVFPEGEDPDSYSQKLGSTAFQEFLKESAQDFLKFKAGLLAKEAANDPIRKAETVKEVVSSIAKIPDPIERAVYLKECSSLLEISEELLIKELNELHRKQLAQESRASAARHSAARQAGGQPGGGQAAEGPPPGWDEYPEDMPPPDEALFFQQPGQVQAQQQAATLENSLRLQEQESVRLLLNYGFNKIEEDFHLYDYLLQEIEELEFQTPLYKSIIDIFKERLAAGQVVDAQYFIKEGSPEVKEEVANLIVEKYDLSVVWKDRHNILIPREVDVLDKAVFQNIVRLKIRTIQKLIQQNLVKLKNATEEAEMTDIQHTHVSLKSAEVELSKLLGIVVVK
jgi:DNA primase